MENRLYDGRHRSRDTQTCLALAGLPPEGKSKEPSTKGKRPLTALSLWTQPWVE